MVEGARTRGDQGRGRRYVYLSFSSFFFFLLFCLSLFSRIFCRSLFVDFLSSLSPLSTFFLLPVVVIARVKFSSLTISLSFNYTQRRLEAVLFDEFVM